jgi:hypothetical protein
VRLRTEPLTRARYIQPSTFDSELNMSVGAILLIVLVLLLVGVNPRWPHSRDWGYAPSGLVGVVLIVLLVLLLVGRI